MHFKYPQLFTRAIPIWDEKKIIAEPLEIDQGFSNAYRRLQDKRLKERSRPKWLSSWKSTVIINHQVKKSRYSQLGSNRISATKDLETHRLNSDAECWTLTIGRHGPTYITNSFSMFFWLPSIVSYLTCSIIVHVMHYSSLVIVSLSPYRIFTVSSGLSRTSILLNCDPRLDSSGRA
jgi:hypothetical protein